MDEKGQLFKDDAIKYYDSSCDADEQSFPDNTMHVDTEESSGDEFIQELKVRYGYDEYKVQTSALNQASGSSELRIATASNSASPPPPSNSFYLILSLFFPPILIFESPNCADGENGSIGIGNLFSYGASNHDDSHVNSPRQRNTKPRNCKGKI